MIFLLSSRFHRRRFWNPPPRDRKIKTLQSGIVFVSPKTVFESVDNDNKNTAVYAGLSFINTIVIFSEHCFICAKIITILILSFSYIFFRIFSCPLYLFPQNFPLPTCFILNFPSFSLAFFSDSSPSSQRFPRYPSVLLLTIIFISGKRYS